MSTQDSKSPSPPAWLEELVDHIAVNLEPESFLGPLGYLYGEDSGFWEVIVYPTPVELIGGAADGEIVAPGFTLDVEGLRAGFDDIADCSWNAFGHFLGEGPYLAIEGRFQDHDVFVRILAYAPDDEEPGSKIDSEGGGIL